MHVGGVLGAWLLPSEVSWQAGADPLCYKGGAHCWGNGDYPYASDNPGHDQRPRRQHKGQPALCQPGRKRKRGEYAAEVCVVQ